MDPVVDLQMTGYWPPGASMAKRAQKGSKGLKTAPKQAKTALLRPFGANTWKNRTLDRGPRVSNEGPIWPIWPF
jgi:hypothetical protein